MFGANGYIGQNLCMALLQHGYKVMATGRKPSWCVPSPISAEAEYRVIDVSDVRAVAGVSFAVDLIFVLSGMTGTMPGFRDYANFIGTNEVGLLNILRAYTDQGSKARIVFPSTRLVYRGSKGKMLAEHDEKNGKSVYAINKLACEKYLGAWSNSFDMSYSIFRICVPYGHVLPGRYSYGTLGFMVKQALSSGTIEIFGDGGQFRTFTHVADICDILIGVAQLPAGNQKIYNIGGMDHLPLASVARLVSERFGAHLSFKAWPEADLRIETGDTMFDDACLQADFPYRYKRQLQEYISSLEPHSIYL